MSRTLAEYAVGRDNNFNLIRFIAAFLVLFSHSFSLATGDPAIEPPRRWLGMSWGDIAVDVFFVTSGFLVTASYLARRNLLAFFWARALRIFPALVVANLFCVLVIGLYFTSRAAGEFLGDSQTHAFVLKNSLLFFDIEYGLPGVFDEVPYQGVINGSLWTLPYEVKMYVILALMLWGITRVTALAPFLNIGAVMLSIAVVALLMHLSHRFHGMVSEEFIRLFSMFFVGAAFFVWKERIRLSPWLFALALALLLASVIHSDAFSVVYYLLLPFIVFYLAYVPGGIIRGFNRYGDYSYGIYIYAFPVQQSLAALIAGVSIPLMVAGSGAVTLVLAMLSWHLVEKPFLRLKGMHIGIRKRLQSFRVMPRFDEGSD